MTLSLNWFSDKLNCDYPCHSLHYIKILHCNYHKMVMGLLVKKLSQFTTKIYSGNKAHQNLLIPNI